MEFSGVEFLTKPKFVKRVVKELKYLNLKEREAGIFWSRLKYHLVKSGVKVEADNHVRLNLEVIRRHKLVFTGTLEVFIKPKISRELRRELRKGRAPYGEELVALTEFKIEI